ncbi:D-alanyl-lipoteichoic acid biosynthesis protein DltD [Eggerthellaceae bacterium zg-1084]|uniref:D-alanyl-lipoteichoic acid biosynthesis protein DltD n=3 Tax=Berryella wangjianweii TaxID=2734634 RepID=A0A6M8J5Z8_9ACTN|nr:D-alanyl-lipoteichoic acid biosynthesis protein DltD [Berryella wangjianweii]NPD32041.1 D-alanyl-lipoteichoic acid biosynthesis protein DltD [Eggerthellaceae bacterium zg-997]QKF07376.1 D-alanyl-lipoteichoic acid biosynthesis protein DltD [Berryella wangjianweii]
MRMLRGVLGGLLAAALAFGGATATLPQMAEGRDDKVYDYIYSKERSSFPAYVARTMSKNGYLTFGSSELATTKSLVPTVPSAVLGEHNAGVDMTSVGTTFCQSLWHAVAAGAYDSHVEQRKVVFLLSPQWFFKENGWQHAFKQVYSHELYREFCSNPNIPDHVKSYVRTRMGQLGVDEGSIAAANHDTPLDAINDQAMHMKDVLMARASLTSMEATALPMSDERRSGKVTEPDWDALMEEGRQIGPQKCTNNPHRFHDGHYTRYLGKNYEKDENFHEADAEYADFKCFLEVCKACGWQPLVMIMPVNGPWYDISNVSREERARFYQRIIDMCNDAGATYADFSSCEYEPYFLCDPTHPGWVGWVRMEKAVYDFVHGRDDEFLGGAGFGTAEGIGMGPLDQKE